MSTTLIFVYNADSGPVSGLLDLGHKILSPSTYQCSLCSLTHGPFTEKEAWKEFRQSVGMPMEFLHRDEFESKYDLKFEYPVILKKNSNIEILLTKGEIDTIADLDELILAVKKEISGQA
ncbi:MAG: GTPase [Chlorobiaceae bacterium]|nr:GTPase [Chlorobiaceae bacterium]